VVLVLMPLELGKGSYQTRAPPGESSSHCACHRRRRIHRAGLVRSRWGKIRFNKRFYPLCIHAVYISASMLINK